MAEKKQTSQGKNNSLIWGVIVIALVGSWFGNEIWLKLADWSKIGYYCAVVLGCIGLFMTTDHSTELWSFMKESKIELRKVVWPDKNEAIRITGIVILVVIAVSIVLSLIDRVLFSMIAMLTQM